ncbi:unnamed protein product [Cylindrotheca closterium]|uniref:PsbP C-terminal domain-containing protein n=1 Tax=Cylindrotheca closterium TaxID=2856 RepID=A0AAD2JL39_9STRA|nr:unnamed protein product [Cylindrotheca closterium]
MVHHSRLLQSVSSLILLLVFSTVGVNSFFLPSKSAHYGSSSSSSSLTVQSSSTTINHHHHHHHHHHHGADPSSRDNDDSKLELSASTTRRQFWTTTIASAAGIVLGTTGAATTTTPANAFDRTDSKFSYRIQIPDSMKEGSKPVKTHQDEVNFGNSEIRGYQYGITVDPVRINSLKEFGTPEEVAARVVTAEVNRDGVFEVTLLKDPEVSNDDGGYLLEYLSSGKRGNKHYINKIFIDKNELYVLTAQCKQENFEQLEQELKATVKSFKV